jgi:hypothetical protein
MQDFGNIKTIFNNILIDGIIKKDKKSKNLFKKYLKTIKESEILKDQFLVYNNIETKIEKDFNSAALYVSENIKILKKYKVHDILEENKKLLNLLENKKLNKTEDNKLHESLSYLILTESNANNVDKITNELKNIINYINNNELPKINESIDLPNSLITKIMVEKYNEKYADLDLEDKELLKVLLNSDLNSKKEYYNKTVNECLELVNNLLENTNEESKDKLIKVKEKLLKDKNINENQLLEKIIKLIDLKNNLIN